VKIERPQLLEFDSILSSMFVAIGGGKVPSQRKVLRQLPRRGVGGLGSLRRGRHVDFATNRLRSRLGAAARACAKVPDARRNAVRRRGGRLLDDAGSA
jgi:hypothetical protein